MKEHRIFLPDKAISALAWLDATQVRVRARGIVSGDLLWVAERWHRDETETRYAADGYRGPCKPAITMPRALARLVLRTIDVRTTRALDISRQDAWDEGWDTEWERKSDWGYHLGDPSGGAPVEVVRVVRVRPPIEILDEIRSLTGGSARLDRLFAEARHNIIHEVTL